MGYLLPILLAVSSLLLREWVGEPRGELPWVVFALVPSPYLLVYLRRQSVLRGAFRRAASLGKLEKLLPAALQLVAVGLLGWLGSLEGWFGTDLSILTWPEPELLLGLLPFVLSTLASIDAESRASGPDSVRRGVRAFQVRMFLAALGPILLYILFASFLGHWEFMRIGVEEVALWSLAFTVILAILFVFALPYFLRVVWETERITEGPQFDVLKQVADLANFRCRELLLWKTGGLMANAAIVGLIPRTRRVFFTDALLRQMGARQLAAVFAHEIGHAKRYHVLILLATALAFFGALDAVLTGFAIERESVELAVLASGLFVWLLAFGWLSRRIELEADLYCLELLRDGIGITSALQAVAPTSHDKPGWRHFSTNQRIEFLGRAAADPKVGRRLRRRLVTLGVLATVLFLAVSAWRLVDFVEAYPLERTVVDLRLGRFEEALERSSRPPDGASGNRGQEAILALIDLLESSAPLPALESREAASQFSGERALEALRAHQGPAAVGWLSLAALTGDAQAERAAERVRARLEGAAPNDLAFDDLGVWAEGVRDLVVGD